MPTRKFHHYSAWVQNSSGASETLGSFSSIREAETFIRARYGAGWTAHIEGIWIDGDGHSYNPAANQEVRSFTLRK